MLTGPVIDQVARHGILARIRDLGLLVLLVERLWADEDSGARSARDAAQD